MGVPVFYAPPDSFGDDKVQLPPSEAHHAVKVLRLRSPEPVIVIDGRGSAYRGEIDEVGRGGTVTVRFHSRQRGFGEPGVELTLAVCLSTGARLSWIVEKGTELGVSRVVPVMTQKSS